VHIDATRALLALLLLLSKKSCLGTICGPLWDAFLWSAAILLNVHGMYGETITCVCLTIAPQCHAHFYNPSEFANESHLNCEHMVHFLASVGVTVAKAETWQQWAAAYVDMSLTEHPEDMLLQEAMWDAHVYTMQTKAWSSKRSTQVSEDTIPLFSSSPTLNMPHGT